MCFRLLISTLAFIVVGADVRREQWTEGEASAFFNFGTVCLIIAPFLQVSRPKNLIHLDC
jgi:hypothetical protein